MFNKSKKKRETPKKKWVQKEGTTCDDIIFTDGEKEITFDEWLSLEYN